MARHWVEDKIDQGQDVTTGDVLDLIEDYDHARRLANGRVDENNYLRTIAAELTAIRKVIEHRPYR
jgi:hypothetical protein